MSYTFKETTIDNGMRICAECSEDAVTSAIGFFVKTGARDEDTSLMGVSHFLEHMMFKGTDSRTAEEVDLAFDSLGAEHNAFTSSEMTAFWGAGLPEVLPEVTDILTDILRPALRQSDFDAEKKVILEEIAMYDDQPFWVMYEHAMEKYYGTSPLGHRVLGTPQTIRDMKHGDLASYFYDRYSSDNSVVVMAGNIDFDLMVDTIQQQCSSWERTGATRKHESINRFQGRYVKEMKDLHQQYILMMMPSVSFQDPRRHAASALAAILGGADSSRLHWSLVDAGLAEVASASVDTNDGFGEQMVWAVCTPDDAEQVTDIIQNEMNTLCDSITEEDLSRVVAKAATGAAVASERPSGRMQRLGSMLTISGEYSSLENELQTIEQLTVQDLQEVAEAFPWKPKLLATTSQAD